MQCDTHQMDFVYSSANFPRTREHWEGSKVCWWTLARCYVYHTNRYGLANLKHPQLSMEPQNRREPDEYRSSINTRSAIIKVRLLFNDSTSQRMEKDHLTKLAPASQWGALYSIILLPLRIRGCRSASRCSNATRLWNLKHPILKAFSKH